MNTVDFDWEKLIYNGNNVIICTSREQAKTFLTAVQRVYPRKMRQSSVDESLAETWDNYDKREEEGAVGYTIAGSGVSFCRSRWYRENGFTAFSYEDVLISNDPWESPPLSELF